MTFKMYLVLIISILVGSQAANCQRLGNLETKLDQLIELVNKKG